MACVATMVITGCQGSEPAAEPTTTSSAVAAGATASPSDSTIPEAPTPTVPDGWQVLDTGDLRLAAPPDWTTPLTEGCAFEPAAGVVVVRRAGSQPAPTCSPSAPPARSAILVETGAFDQVEGRTVQLGTLPAMEATNPPCDGCNRYRVLPGIDVIARGPDAGAVLATLSTGGARRALAPGPLVDTSRWVPVEQDGVSVLVPPVWARRQLGTPPTTVITPTGERYGGGTTDPGVCGGALFAAGQPTAFVGSSVVVPSCPAPVRRDLTPADGVWVHEDRGHQLARNETPPTTVGHALAVIDDDRADGGSGPMVRLLVPNGGDDVELVVGVGADPAIARTILSTLRVDR